MGSIHFKDNKILFDRDGNVAMDVNCCCICDCTCEDGCGTPTAEADCPWCNYCIVLCSDTEYCSKDGCGYISWTGSCSWSGTFTSGTLSGESILFHYNSATSKWVLNITNCISGKEIAGFSCHNGYSDAYIRITPVTDKDDCTCDHDCGCYNYSSPGTIAVSFAGIDNTLGLNEAGDLCCDNCDGGDCGYAWVYPDCCPESYFNGSTFYLTISGYSACGVTQNYSNCGYHDSDHYAYPIISITFKGNDCQQGYISLNAYVYEQRAGGTSINRSVFSSGTIYYEAYETRMCTNSITLNNDNDGCEDTGTICGALFRKNGAWGCNGTATVELQ